MPAITYSIAEAGGMFAWRVWLVDGRTVPWAGLDEWRLSRAEAECDAFNAAMFACVALAAR